MNVEGPAECVRLFVSHGADVHAQDVSLRTPLLVACEVSALAAARHIMMGSAKPCLTVADENGMTCAHWLASHGECETLALVLQRGGEVDARNSSQQTPLHLAITRGRLACALVLLDAGAKSSAVDEERRNAMHLAMQYSGGMGQCSESTLLLLRLLQLDASLVQSVDADKRTPLHWACGKNALPCVRALIQSGSAIDAIDWAGRAPIHWAVLVDAAESASELVTAGADPTLADRDQRTPLHWAADRASEKCLKLLLQTQLGSEIDAVDWGGYSALHYAARRGAIGCVKMLLGHGASRRLVAMNGELPTDLTSCATTKALLNEQVGMKRQVCPIPTARRAACTRRVGTPASHRAAPPHRTRTRQPDRTRIASTPEPHPLAHSRLNRNGTCPFTSDRTHSPPPTRAALLRELKLDGTVYRPSRFGAPILRGVVRRRRLLARVRPAT